jgi:hypothetical protein
MGEKATNALMQEISDDPSVIDQFSHEDDSDFEPAATRFEISETRLPAGGNGVRLITKIGGVDVSDFLYERLRSLFIRNNEFDLLTPDYLSDMRRLIFMLIYRYSYVDPGFKRQGYLGSKYFQGISDAFERKIDLEGFASAVNATVPKYCSLFLDVEEPFGSIGSFFDIKDLGHMTLVQVSPPRIGEITMQAVRHCAKLLHLTTDRKEDYHIILLTPNAWEDVSRTIEATRMCLWRNIVRPGTMIDYFNPVTGKSSAFPMPRVSVLSNANTMKPRTAAILAGMFNKSS